MIFKNNKYLKHVLSLIILTSCATASKNKQNQTFQVQIPKEERTLEEISEYKQFFDNDLNVIQEFLENKEINQDDRRQIKLLKTNYKKILSHKDYVLKLNSENKYSRELIKFIYDSNLPIKILWEGTSQSALPENLLDYKVNGFCSSLYEDASIDKSRVYLSGVSMGGSGTWYWSAAHPEQFAGIISVCGLSETEKAPNYKDVAIQIFHGEKDAVVPYQRSLDMYTALKKNGANALIYEFKNKGHNIARELFNGKDLSHLEWLFKQKKNVQSAGKNSGFFKQQVLPILEDKCIRCHGEKKQKGDFRLDSRAAILKGGGSGAVINFHKPQSSLFIHAISHEDAELAMPPKKKMEDREIEILTKWIKEGLHWPGQMDTVVEKTEPDEFITDEMKNHWAFQPLKKVRVPEVEWGNNPIDKFLYQAMKKKGLNPQKDAPKNILARRLFYNLTGLPPTLEQLNSIEKEGKVDKLVETLLSSKAYGEKWGRHWLDVARYADSNGSEVDHAMANAWRYRDYVIDSFNKDKPFNRFIKAINIMVFR